jgi:hypothetical protein
VSRDAIFTVVVIDQPRPECLITKALTCIVQDVDEFERAFDPELVAFSLLLQSVLDLRPSEVEVSIAKRSGSVSAGAVVSAVGLLVSVTGALVLRTCMCFLLAYLKSVVVVISPARGRANAVIAGYGL